VATAASAPAQAPTTPPDPMADLKAACANLTQLRQRPLLVLFYPWTARISEVDLDDVYETLRASGATPENRIPELDVLVDSYGGGPVGGYRLAQLIRDFCDDAAFLVPDHAYSAATLLCFAGNEVRLAHFAGLSPIDITLLYPRKEVELATVESFMEFAQDARKKIEELLARMDSKGQTSVEADLLVAMVKEIGAMQVGKYYRERNLTGQYAEMLLESYMFADDSDKLQRRQDVIQNFLFRAPAHDFHLDYHLCAEWGVKAVEMPTAESDLAKKVLKELNNLADNDVICRRVNNNKRFPYFGWYVVAGQAAPTPTAQQTGGNVP
jgi:serine dehydrogenase proteinase